MKKDNQNRNQSGLEKPKWTWNRICVELKPGTETVLNYFFKELPNPKINK
jgi:hypothetical protein